MIHGGLTLRLENNKLFAQHCCLKQKLVEVDSKTDVWSADFLQPLRRLNREDKWDINCKIICKGLESSGHTSFRLGMNQGLGIENKFDVSGPARIDLTFNRSCNLACRICGPESSTYWEKHLRENNLYSKEIETESGAAEVIAVLSKLNLSNLKMLVFCGGETLLGQEYWKVSEWLGDNVPGAKENLTLCFQTNGTQPISPRNYKTIEKFFLVKLHISLDGIEKQFEYMRWPASWQQVTDNILDLKNNAPSNVMFLVEETLSIFNLASSHRLDTWVKENFTTNREGDIVNHTRHIARDMFGLSSLSIEYAEYLKNTAYSNLINFDFKENASAIRIALSEIEKFDRIRGESFHSVFPEATSFYQRFQ